MADLLAARAPAPAAGAPPPTTTTTTASTRAKRTSKKREITSIGDISVKRLIKYIFETWHADSAAGVDEIVEDNGEPELVSIYQIRLIHLGRALEEGLNFERYEDKFREGRRKSSVNAAAAAAAAAGDQDSNVADSGLTVDAFEGYGDDDYDEDDDDDEGLLLGDLKLDISDVIHVSLRPVESLRKIRRKSNRHSLLSAAVGNNNARRLNNSRRASKVVSGDDEENSNANLGTGSGGSGGGGGGCCVIV